jgi:hypothetical protein
MQEKHMWPADNMRLKHAAKQYMLAHTVCNMNKVYVEQCLLCSNSITQYILYSNTTT